ncbi:MAG: hypothetical protein C4576_08255 [Desulfobacteraceae bacterium]|nr:MAG: hypothetical protein C4576_08255 [Desulfobacteraceae bacterium]
MLSQGSKSLAVMNSCGALHHTRPGRWTSIQPAAVAALLSIYMVIREWQIPQGGIQDDRVIAHQLRGCIICV